MSGPTETQADAPGPRRPWSRTERPVPRLMLRPLQQFLRLEVAGGLVLLAATAAALVWANVDAGSYEDLWSTRIAIQVGDWELVESLRQVINDGLMALFFLVIGLEVKRELTVGELRTRRAALLPAVAALGGMALPALLFLAVAGGGQGAEGWGVPLATDVAFALGALMALGRRVPPALVAFLLAVAVVDDIGAVLVVALAYSEAIELGWLGLAVAGLVAIGVLQRIGVRYIGTYVALGLVVWFATFESGVHATIAGVALGLLTPVRPFQHPAAVSTEARRVASATADAPASPDADAGHWRRLAWLAREAISPLNRVEHGLHQWSSFVVLPLFALANAGIVLDGAALDALGDTRVAPAVAVGLVAGKTLGLAGAVAIAVRLRLADLPRGVGWDHIVGVAALAGIGFTVSLFIADLAYSDPTLIAAAKLGVLGGSALAAILGMSLLALAARRRARPRPAGGGARATGPLG